MPFKRCGAQWKALRTGLWFKWRTGFGNSCVFWKETDTSRHRKKKLTRTGDNRDVTEQAEDLRAKEGAVPNIEELVEKNLRAGKTLLMETGDMFN